MNKYGRDLGITALSSNGRRMWVERGALRLDKPDDMPKTRVFLDGRVVGEHQFDEARLEKEPLGSLMVINGLTADRVAFSSDGSGYTYRVQDWDKWRAVVNGTAGPAYDAIATPFFTDGGRTVGYFAEIDKRWRLVLDGHAGPTLENLVRISWTGPGELTVVAMKDGVPVKMIARRP
jgi:hypothetical protein